MLKANQSVFVTLVPKLFLFNLKSQFSKKMTPAVKV